MERKDLNILLEGVECHKKNLKENVTPRDMSDLGDLIDRMGFNDFILTLIEMLQREDAPVQDPEDVVDYLREILNLQRE